MPLFWGAVGIAFSAYMIERQPRIDREYDAIFLLELPGFVQPWQRFFYDGMGREAVIKCFGVDLPQDFIYTGGLAKGYSLGNGLLRLPKGQHPA